MLRRVAHLLKERGFARLTLDDTAQETLSANLRPGFLALQSLNAFHPDYHHPGNEQGLAAGFHYFATNDPGGRVADRDGESNGLRFSRTWDLRGRSNPDWPGLARPQAMLSAVRDLFIGLAHDLAVAFRSRGGVEGDYLSGLLSEAAHDGTVLRTIMSPGASTAAVRREKKTRHIWHADATLFTMLSLRDFAHTEPAVSRYDRLIVETRDGGLKTIEPTPGDVLVFAGRHLAAALDTRPVTPLRHAVVSEQAAPRMVTMLRIGFDPAATSLQCSSGRPVTTRDGLDVSSGRAFYGHLAALRGAPLLLDEGLSRRTIFHRGTVEGYK